MKIKKWILTTVVNAFALVAFSQGSIKVVVFDGNSGETLIGATAVIDGTTQGAITDLDGIATINDLDPGTYDVKVSFISFQPQKIENIEISGNEVKTFNVKMVEESLGLEEVVITGKVIESSENALLTVQKKSPRLLDAISADQFSRTGDGDAAAAVKRVVGVTIESGKYVYVRGLGDRYSKAVLNGGDLPGLDPNKNSVQLDLFPSNLIDNIIVYKTFTPDLTGEFTGGLVDVSTKEFPDQFTLQASASVGYNPVSNLNSSFLTYQGGSTDWLGMDDGTRELPAILGNYTQANWPRPFMGQDIQVDQVTKSFESSQFQPERSSQFMDYGFSLSIGNKTSLFGKELGILGGLTYKKDYSFYEDGAIGRWEVISANVTDLYRSKQFELSDSKSSIDATWGGLLNTTLKLNSNGKVGLNLMHNQSGVSEARYQEGLWNKRLGFLDSSNIYQSRVLSWTERGVSNAQLKGEHVVPALGNTKIDWFSSYTRSTLDQPDLRFLANDYEIINETTRIYTISNQNRPGRYFRDMNENNFDNRLNISVPINNAKIKFGGAYTRKNREYRENRYEYLLSSIVFDGDPNSPFIDENLGLNSSGQLTGHVLDNFTQEVNNYDADQTIGAGYVMVETPIFPKLKTTTGLRYEYTNMNLNTTDGQISGELTNNDFLPSVALTYELSESSNLRGSYSRTLARPTFREFAPTVTFAFYGDYDQLGNSNLKRTLIDNFDLRWEIFPRSGEYIGVSAFFKVFHDPIENTFNPNAGGGSKEFKYENVDQAQVIGAEIEIRKSLDFISMALRDFKLSTNFTYIQSRVNIEADELSARRAVDPNASDTRQMFNQSPFVVNASLAYDSFENGWASALTFNVFGERLKLISTDLLDVYEQPRPDLNFMLKKKVGNLSVSLRANNLLDSPYKQTIDFKGTEEIFSSYRVGRSFSLGLSYTIN